MIHRDDIPIDDMAKIEEAIRKAHPEFADFKIVCAGDAPEGDLPPDVASAFDMVQRSFDRSLVLGACIDCDARMPNYPSSPEGFAGDWQPTEGWRSFSKIGEEDSFAGWQCPTCDAKEDDDAAV